MRCFKWSRVRRPWSLIDEYLIKHVFWSGPALMSASVSEVAMKKTPNLCDGQTEVSEDGARPRLNA